MPVSTPVFGHLPGVPPGTVFDNRIALSVAGVHPARRAGISGTQQHGATSIVLSGAYEDDEDYGDEIIYTGRGGRSSKTGKQTSDQALNHQNLALAKSRTLGLPVRVTRGPDPDSLHAPETGYRYDGLYRITDQWRERGRSGYYVWRFRLERLER